MFCQWSCFCFTFQLCIRNYTRLIFTDLLGFSFVFFSNLKKMQCVEFIQFHPRVICSCGPFLPPVPCNTRGYLQALFSLSLRLSLACSQGCPFNQLKPIIILCPFILWREGAEQPVSCCLFFSYYRVILWYCLNFKTWFVRLSFDSHLPWMDAFRVYLFAPHAHTRTRLRSHVQARTHTRAHARTPTLTRTSAHPAERSEYGTGIA